MTQISQLLKMFKPLMATVDNLSLRERLLVFATVLMLLGSAWYLGLVQPLDQQATRDRSEIASLRERIDLYNQSLEVEVLQVSSTGTGEREKLARIQGRLDEINERLAGYVAELIDPAQMSRVLQDLLKKQSKLRFIRVRNISPEALSASTDDLTTTFYRHGIEIEFEGSYLACLEYLQEIEELPWRFYWQLLDIEVLEYPRNRIRLEVSTLSPDVEWIGA